MSAIKPADYDLVIRRLPEDEGGGYLAYYPDLPGCISDGETRAEAAAGAEDALLVWLEVQEERGASIPKPGDAIRDAETYLREREDKLIDALKAVSRVRTHSQNITMAARAQAERKTFGHRS